MDTQQAAGDADLCAREGPNREGLAEEKVLCEREEVGKGHIVGVVAVPVANAEKEEDPLDEIEDLDVGCAVRGFGSQGEREREWGKKMSQVRTTAAMRK